MEPREILDEWLMQTDQSQLKEGHYFVICEAMKEFAKQETEKAINYKRCSTELFCKDCNGVNKKNTWIDKSKFSCDCDKDKTIT